MEFKQLKKTVGRNETIKASLPKRHSSTLVVVDIQEDAPIGKINMEELALFMEQYDRVFYVIDQIMSSNPSMPYDLLDYYEENNKGRIPSNIEIIEKEYGGLLRISADMGLEDEAVDFFKSMNKGTNRDDLEKKHGGFLDALMNEMGDDDYDDLFDRLQYYSDKEYVSGIDDSVIERMGSKVDMCGGAKGECLKEMEMMFDIVGTKAHIVDKFTY